MPANMIPALLDHEQKPTRFKEDGRETIIKKQKNKGQKDLLKEIDLAGLEEWNEAEEKEA